ncbi:MAG TPA: isoprenylcysteine carboxylmethyltransferase family protein [Candidatus Dormibacteraeota bacterium]|nr:isoprenylcysteine carboxylmethyltransferase family protein [Candidatus Dormibacteraeota bacterium]
MTVPRYAAVLLAFGSQRGFELIYSAKNERSIHRQQPGAPQAARSIFKWIALVNLGLFTLPALERWLRRRPPPSLVAGVGWVAALAGVALRLSVLVSLRDSWNVHAVVPSNLRIVDSGPYRFIRHPNYLALGLEFLGLPLIGGAYLSALGLGLANAALLRQRIIEEEALLMAIPAYRERMAGKPRILPRRLTGR